MGLLLADGPLLWGLLTVPFAIILPVLASVPSSSIKCRFAIVMYIIFLVNVVILLRYYGYVIPSEIVDHGTFPRGTFPHNHNESGNKTSAL
jgi:hypothetical protein